MYLSQLNTDQKELFLSACIHLSSADGHFSADEKQLVTQLCQEMQIPVRMTAEKEFDETVTEFASISGNREKKIAMLELAGVVFADGVFDEAEKEFMIKVAEKFGYEKSVVDETVDIVGQLYHIYRLCAKFISN